MKLCAFSTGYLNEKRTLVLLFASYSVLGDRGIENLVGSERRLADEDTWSKALFQIIDHIPTSFPALSYTTLGTRLKRFALTSSTRLIIGCLSLHPKMITIFRIDSLLLLMNFEIVCVIKENFKGRVASSNQPHFESLVPLKVVKVRQFEEHLAMIALKRDAGQNNNKRSVRNKA